MSSARRCAGENKDGTQCRKVASPHDDVCNIHARKRDGEPHIAELRKRKRKGQSITRQLTLFGMSKADAEEMVKLVPRISLIGSDSMEIDEELTILRKALVVSFIANRRPEIGISLKHVVELQQALRGGALDGASFAVRRHEDDGAGEDDGGDVVFTTLRPQP